MAATLTVRGNTVEAIAALEALGIKAEETGAKADAAFGDGLASKTEKTGGMFSKLGNIVSGLGLPFGESFGKMGESVEGADTKGKNLFHTMSTIGGAALLGVAAAAGVAAGESIHLAENYQKATANLAANAGITMKSAEAIGKTFLNTAGKSTFSAQEIMTAYGPVAAQLATVQGKALDNQQAMQFMSAAMDLAEGTGANLASTTGSLATVMQAYGLSTGKASATSDLLFNVSTKTGVGMGSLTSSLQRLHTQMGANTPSLQQTGGLLLDLVSHGETGRAAMSALSTAFNGMLMPSTKVAETQKALGVSFVNSKGQMLPLKDILAELKEKTAGMGNAQAETLLKSLGLGSASAKLLAVIQAGPAAFEEDVKAAGKLGTAHEAAGKQADTMKGQLEKLKSAGEDLATSIGQKLIPWVDKIVGALAKVAEWILNHKAVLEGFGVLIGVVLVAFIGSFIASLFVAGGALAFVSAEMVIATGGLVLLVPVLIYVVTHWKQVWSDMKEWAHKYTLEIGAALMILSGGMLLIPVIALFVYEHWKTLWSYMKTATRDFVNFFTDIPGEISRFFERIWQDATSWISRMWHDVTTYIINLKADVGRWLTQTVNDVYNFFHKMWSDATVWASRLVTDVGGWFGRIWSHISNAIKNIGTDLLNFGKSIMGDLIKGITAGAASLPGLMTHIAKDLILGPVKSLLKWASPSLVFHDLGMSLMKGLSNGVEAGKSGALASIASVANNVAAIAGGLGAVQATTGYGNYQSLGQSMAAQAPYNWTGQEWVALNNVAMRESGWNPNAQNPTSSAYGIAQNIGGRGAYPDPSPAGQIAWMLNYIKGRYGDPIGAWAHELSAGWYDSGGILPPGLTMAMNNTGAAEYVLRPTPGNSGGGGEIVPTAIYMEGREVGKVTWARSRKVGLQTTRRNAVRIGLS